MNPDLLRKYFIMGSQNCQRKPEDILVISTHRPMLASKLANRVVFIERGQIVRDGKPEKVIPEMMKRFTPKPISQPQKGGPHNVF